MQIPFSKYSGCGNDFILIDNRKGNVHLQPERIARLCQRCYGIGADGIIFLEYSTKADFRMRIFNADGSEAEMCGNGIRCLMQFIQECGCNTSSCLIETKQYIAELSLQDQGIAVSLPPPTEITWEIPLEIGDKKCVVHYLNTGVPHAVLFVAPDRVDPWMALAPKIRGHARFAPRGTNVNFVHVEANGELWVRTYERGVEQETESCGTGAIASAIAAAFLYRLCSPLKVIPKSKIPTWISFEKKDGQIEHLKMTGPAEKIFHGVISSTLCNF